MHTATPFDPVIFKANTRDQWNRSAEGWQANRDQIRAWLRKPTQAMLDHVAEFLRHLRYAVLNETPRREKDTKAAPEVPSGEG